MERAKPATPARSAPPRGPFYAAVAVAVALSFTAGLLFTELVVSSAAPPPARAAAAAEPAAAPPATAALAPSPAPAVAVAPASPLAAMTPATAGPSPLLTAQGRPTPALVARVTDEAARSLEAAKADLTARCVRERARTAPGRFLVNVVFDASGREVARGISEDRRHRAPEVASCLRALPLGALQVSPPGASVGVRVALNLP